MRRRVGVGRGNGWGGGEVDRSGRVGGGGGRGVQQRRGRTQDL